MLSGLETLWETRLGDTLLLPAELQQLYGPLAFPPHPDRPYVLGNFVTSLDGVTSLQIPGQEGGGAISGNNAHDHFVMGLLRAVADAVIVGAGTLRAAPDHLWTAEYISPDLADAFQDLRASLGKSGAPLNAIVTASGKIDPAAPVFQSGKVPVLLVTTARGAPRLRALNLPASVQIAESENSGKLSAGSILEAVARVRNCDLILVEGGPHLLGDFFAAHRLDEQFLTLSPQIAGRNDPATRPGLVAGQTFAPDHPLWGTLTSIKRANNHLFLRYTFPSK